MEQKPLNSRRTRGAAPSDAPPRILFAPQRRGAAFFSMRILHIGLGPLGKKLVHDLYDRSLGELVGAIDVSSEVAGRKVSSVVKGTRCALPVLPSLERFRGWSSVDCAIVTTSSALERCEPTFRALLERGLPVVSTCEELVWPWLRRPDLAASLDRLAKKKGGRLLGTGVNPGFVMDALPLFSTAVCRSVDSLHVWRIQDASSRRIPFQQKIGVGLDEREFLARVHAGTLRHVGLGESLHLLAHRLGWTIDHWDEELSFVPAARALASGIGRVARGAGAGVRQVAHGFEGERLRIVLEFQAASGQADPHDRVLVRGEPELDLRVEGGIHGDVATSAITLNAAAVLPSAVPGLHDMSSVPLVHFAPARPVERRAGARR
jgi:4-hydroxy-tetrahydrodipicolinate reductase